MYLRRCFATMRPSDSLLKKDLKFGSNTRLREEYANHFGDIRVGMILEDLDAFAGVAAYLHAVPSLRAQVDHFSVNSRENFAPTDSFGPITIVTAACNRIDLHERLNPEHDVQLRGNVVYVGK